MIKQAGQSAGHKNRVGGGVRCGNRIHVGAIAYHPTVADVRACYQLTAKATTQPAPAAVFPTPAAGAQGSAERSAILDNLRGHHARTAAAMARVSGAPAPAPSVAPAVALPTFVDPPTAPAEASPPPAPKAQGRSVTEDGMYRTPDGEIFKVQRAVHGSGQLYAKRLISVEPYEKVKRGKTVTVTHEFVYAPGAIRDLSADMRMTLAQAVEYGALYGVCCVCSTTLTSEKSIEAGIGPICGGRV